MRLALLGSATPRLGDSSTRRLGKLSPRWRLWWDTVEWTNVTGKPTAIARIQNVTGTYASIDITGTTNNYSGIRFPDSYQDQTLMLHATADQQGVYRQAAGAWSWYWQNGTLVVGSVPWANVTNKPTTLAGYGITDGAPLASPAFTGTPTAPTPTAGDNTTKLATTAFVRTAVAAVPWSNITGEPTTLAGYGITDAAPLASPAFTGAPTAPTPAAGDNTTKLATTGFVQSAVAAGGGGLLSTTTLAPSGGSSGITETSGRPGAMPISWTSTSSTVDVTIFSITGKGRLRFPSTGHSTSSGAAFLTVIVDGTTIVNAQSFQGTAGGASGTPLVVPVVGSIAGSETSAGMYFTSPIPEGDGFEFKSSVTVKARVNSGAGYIAWSYRLYA